MNAIRTLALVALSSLAVSAMAMQPLAGKSPLDPDAYVGQPAKTADWVASEPYRDSGNPLSPSFRRGPEIVWEPTAFVASPPYRDDHNPLYPGYRR